jgi:hypothetical protein
MQNVCVPGNNPPVCQVDSDCQQNESCVNGVCQSNTVQCMSDADCPMGQQCNPQTATCQ